MNNMVLKSNSNISITIGNDPMVLLPLNVYELFVKSLDKLKSKNLIKNLKRGSFLAVASESSLSKDWLRAEEEKAWQNL